MIQWQMRAVQDSQTSHHFLSFPSASFTRQGLPENSCGNEEKQAWDTWRQKTEDSVSALLLTEWFWPSQDNSLKPQFHVL